VEIMKRTHAVLRLAIWMAATTPAPVFAEEASTLEARLGALVGRPGGLTAEEVAKRAEATSFDVRARREEVVAAAAAVDQALVSYFPRLNLGVRFSRLSPIAAPVLGSVVVAPTSPAGPIGPGSLLVNAPISFPVLLNQTTLQATLSIPISDYILRITQNHAAQNHSARAAEITEKATRLKIATDGRVAYYSWARARLQVLVAEQSVAQSQGHLRDVRRAYEVGTSSKADLMRVESLLATAELLLERARDLELQLEEQVRIAMHDPERKPYLIGEDLRADLLPLPNAHDLLALYNEAFERRLELRVFDENENALREQTKVARAGYYPRLDAVLDATYANPNPRMLPPSEEFTGSLVAGIQLTWAPNDWAAARAQARQLEARIAQLEAQKELLKDGLRTEVMQSFQAMREALVAIQTTARGLAAAEESYRVRRELFKNGRGTTVEVTDAETELTRARLEAVNARVDLRIARVRLVHAAGRDTTPSASTR
jgi:outer membrane protein TolC